MRGMLMIECACEGALFVNGQFCGPLEDGGQAYPMGRNEEIYIQFFPFSQEIRPLSAAMRLREGEIERLEPEGFVYALRWPEGLVQLELRPEGCPERAGEEETVAESTLLRYLTLRLAGDTQARALLLRAEMEPELPPYDAVVPLRFAPSGVPERYDERAGIVRRISANIARVDAALAITSPAGRGQRRIERIEIMKG